MSDGMSITYNSLPFNPNDYLDARELPAVLEAMEGFVSVPYDDGLGLATIGIGINLMASKNHIALVLNEIGLFAADDAREAKRRVEQGLQPETPSETNRRYRRITDNFSAIFPQYSIRQNRRLGYGNDPSEQALQRALNAEVLKYMPNSGVTFSLSHDQAVNVKNKIILGYMIGNTITNPTSNNEKPISDNGKQKRLDNILTAKNLLINHNTREYKALMSRFYGSEKSCDKVTDAMKDGNRAEAWYCMRYTCNTGKAKRNSPSVFMSGLAKRRIYESELFGLYNNVTKVSLPEAKQALRMLQLHRSEIQSFEASYGKGWDGSPATKRDLVSDAKIDYSTGLNQLDDGAVNYLEENLNPAKTKMIEWLTQSLPPEVIAAYVAANGSLYSIKSFNILLDQSDHGAFGTTISARYIKNKTEIAAANILIGEGGDDKLTGGKGNDLLIGGDGDDTYYYNTGDGNDVIFDSDKKGKIVINGNTNKPEVLGNVYKKKGYTDVYTNAKGQVIITHHSPWQIVLEDGGTITLGDDFQSGDFGISLIDVPDNPTTTNILAGTEDANTIHGTAANDLIQGLGGDDFIDSNAGNDSIVGGSGNDLIVGGAQLGDSIIEGNDGIDRLVGGTGNDKIFAESYGEMDVLVEAGETAASLNAAGDSIGGGAGNDFIYGSSNRDSIAAGPGHDLIVAGGGNDVVWGDFDMTGSDLHGVFSTFQGNDAVYAGTGDDWVYAGDGDDEIVGGEGNDSLMGESGNDAIYGGDGDDLLDGDVWAPVYKPEGVVDGNGSSAPSWAWLAPDYIPGNDFLDGGAGNDQLTGGGGKDTLYGGMGNDFLYGDANATTVYSMPGVPDWTPPAGEAGDDYIDGEEGNDTIYGGDGFDDIYGGEGDDMIAGGSSDPLSDIRDNDYLDGEEGNDTIYGGAGDDELYGGDGVNQLYGGDGNDYIDGETGTNTIQAGAGNDTIYSGDNADLLQGDDGDDYIDGGGGVDTIFGGTGTDDIYGGDGADMLYGQNGADTISGEGGNDRIEGDDIADGGNDYLDGGEGNDTILGAMGSDEIYGGDGDDILHGDAVNMSATDHGSDYMDGGAGNDTLWGYGGNDTLNGGEGSDIIFGNAGDDMIAGGDGNDIYYYNIGDGADTIDDWSTQSELNTIVFGEGITVDNLSISTTEDRLIINVGTGGTDRLELTNFDPDDWFGPNAVGRFSFSDYASVTYEDFIALKTRLPGSDDGETLTGNDLANNLVAMDGSDTLYGMGNSDILNGGAGADSMYGGSGNDRYIVDDAGDTVTELADEGTDIVKSSISYTLTDNVENLTLTGSSATDGTGNDLDNIIAGNSLGNSLTGGVGDDTLDGGTGADTMLGGTGDDVYIVDNSGDVVTELADEGYDEVRSSVSYALSDNVEDLILTGGNAINGTGNSLDNAIYGNSASNVLYGMTGNDILDGGAGNDTLDGGAGDDTYYWDEGYNNDIIVETSGNDTLASSALSSDLEFTLFRDDNYNSILVKNFNTDEALLLKDWFASDDRKIEHFQFADIDLTAAQVQEMALVTGLAGTEGDDNISGPANYGTAISGLGGNDELHGGDLDDTLVGGGDNDTLFGGAGNDRYIWGSGMGNDVIQDRRGADTIVFDGLSSTDVEFAISHYAGDGGILVTVKATGETLRIQNWFLPDEGNGDEYKIETLSFSDVDLTSASQVEGMAAARGVVGTGGNDELWGPAYYGASIQGLGGDDHIGAGYRSDTVYGGAGNDYIQDWYGNNLIDGGAGDDTLEVRTGNNTIVWEPGMGSDTITRRLYNELPGGFNTLKMTGLNSTDVEFFVICDENEMSNNGIIMRVKSTGEVLTLLHDYGRLPIERFSFADRDLYGWEVRQIAEANTFTGTEGSDVIHMSGYYSTSMEGLNGNDTIYGGNYGNTIRGGDGNDYLQGYYYHPTAPDTFADYSGADSLYGGSGNDVLKGGYGNDILDGGNGSDTMIGGIGDDTYIVDSAGDVVVESTAGIGFVEITGDTVESSITYSLGTNIESLTLTGTNDINATGNELNNVLTGNSASNVLNGGLGDDTLNGGLGDDTYIWGAGTGNDTIQDTQGIDTISLGGLNSTDVEFLFSPNREDEGILMRVVTTGEALLVKNWFTDDGNRIENFQFADRALTASEAEALVTSGWIMGTGDNDILAGPGGQASIMNGRGGSDTLTGGDMNDIVFGGSGDDAIDGGAGDDYISAGAGNDFIQGGGGSDTVKGGTGEDTLSGGEGNDTLSDTEGNNAFYGDIGNDTITGGDGDDLVYGGDGNDYVMAGSGDNTVFGDLGDDVLIGGDNNDLLIGGDGNDYIGGGSGSDTIYGGSGDDAIYGDIDEAGQSSSVADDHIEGGAGNDQLYGLIGDDELYGNDGNDYFEGGYGNDTMDGGSGDDAFRIEWGEGGRDVIREESGNDTLNFYYGSSASSGDTYYSDIMNSVSYHVEGDDLMVTNRVTGATLSIEDWFSSDDHKVEHFVYDDEFELTASQAEALATTYWILGGDGDDVLYGPEYTGTTLYGGGGNDTIHGLSGNDTIYGGAGSDIIYCQGGVNDTVYGGDGDDIIFGLSGVAGGGGGANPAIQGHYFGGGGNDSISVGSGVVDLGSGRDTLNMVYQTPGAYMNRIIVARDDSAVPFRAPLVRMAGAYGDPERADAGPDELDTLVFYDGVGRNDLALSTDAGSLVVTVGNETEVYLKGFNPEDAYTASAVDIFRFASGEELTYAQLLDLGINFYGTQAQDALAGTDAPDRIHALGGDDTITGGWQNDTLEGGAGNDTYIFGYGDGTDTIIDTANPGEGNVILFGEGITRDDLRATLDGTTLTIEYGTLGDAIHLVNFDPENVNGSLVTETIRFADNSEIRIVDLLDVGTEGNDTIITGASDDVINARGGDDYVSTNAGNDTIDGGSGNDTILGGDGDDMLTGATGNDVLDGGSGSDTYLYNAGDGTDTISDESGSDTLILGEGYSKDNIDYRLDGNVVRVRSVDSDGSISVTGPDIGTDGQGVPVIETLRFSDNMEIDLAGAFDPQNVVLGTDGFDLIMRGSANDMIYAGSGTDIVMAGAGDDRIYGGDGIDTLYGDGGNDTVFGEEGSDILFGGDGNDALYGGAGWDVLYGDGGNDLLSGGAGSDLLLGGTGNDAIYGGTDDDVLFGNAGEDILIGSAGSDLMTGGSGNDTYIFSLNDGSDTVTDLGADATTSDRVLFTNDVLGDTIALFQSGQNLVIGYGTGDVVTVSSQMSTSSGIEKIELDSGLYLNNADINTVIQQITAFATANGISLTSVNDVRNNQDLMNIVANSWHS